MHLQRDTFRVQLRTITTRFCGRKAREAIIRAFSPDRFFQPQRNIMGDTEHRGLSCPKERFSIARNADAIASSRRQKIATRSDIFREYPHREYLTYFSRKLGDLRNSNLMKYDFQLVKLPSFRWNRFLLSFRELLKSLSFC